MKKQPVKPQPQCYKAGCSNVPAFDVVIRAKVAQSDPGTVTAPVFQCCEQHQDVNMNDVCTPKAWSIVEYHFHRAGKLMPVREWSSVELVPIEKQVGKFENRTCPVCYHHNGTHHKSCKHYGKA